MRNRMGQSKSKIKKGRLAKNGQAVDSGGGMVKRTKKGSKKGKRTERETSSTLALRPSTLPLRPSTLPLKVKKPKKEKSKSLGKRFSKRSTRSKEKKVKSLLRKDSLSLASANSTDSKTIKTTVDSSQFFRTDDLPRLYPLSDYSSSLVHSSALLLANDSSFDKDPLPPSNPDKSGMEGHIDAEEVAQTVAEVFESIPILELDQPMFKYKAIETSSSIQPACPPANEEVSPTDDLPVSSNSEDSEKPANAQRLYSPLKADSSTNKAISHHPLHTFMISDSCVSLEASISEQLPPSFLRGSMDNICSNRKAVKSCKLPLASNLRVQLVNDRQKSSVRFQEKTEDMMAMKLKSFSLCDVRKGKTYSPSSVKLRRKKQNKSSDISAVLDNTIGPWTMSQDMDVHQTHNGPLRDSAIHERDLFLELLSQVQDNRYENQRYTLKAGSLNDPDESNNDDVFDDGRYEENTDIIAVNGTLPNGNLGSTSPDMEVPSIEISPTCTLESSGRRHSISLTGLDNQDDIPGSHSPIDTPCQSLSPVMPPLTAGSVLTPGRKSMEALKKVIESEGPYPLLIEAPDGGYWIENGEYESAKSEDDMWTAPEISTEHYTIQCDLTALAYGGHFYEQEHTNYIARDPVVGPVLFSLKFEEAYVGKQVRAMLRTQTETTYKLFPSSQLPGTAEIEDYIKFVSGDTLKPEKAFKIDLAKGPELIRKFDEHPVAKTHKIGLVYQQFGQTSEEEIFGNLEHPDSLEEFSNMLGTKVNLRGFEGYRGGLDVANDQTGEHSVYTEYKDRQIMFHVSTLLPHDAGDTQHVQKKRHIGNDIVVIVFQEENTPFCPSAIRSHFIHSYIVVQVEHPNTDHTVYKVAVAAKDEVPDFGPPLPDPAVFQKGPDFRDWLLTKILNAEFKCHVAPSFNKLASRTRGQLFLHLVEEITQFMDDVDFPILTNGLGSPIKNRSRRRRTLGGIFNTKKDSSSLTFSLPKRKSISGSPRTYRKLLSEPSSPRDMIVGSTPDLASSLNEQRTSGYPVILANGQTILGPATPNLTELSRNEKGKLRGRFSPKKEVASPKERKKPKRTKSVGGSSGLVLSEYFKRRKDSASPTKRYPVKRESSEESNISSSLNWSVPYDLPSVVEAEISGKRYHEELKNQIFADNFLHPDRCHSNPTIPERKESEVSLSEVQLLLSERPKMCDVAVQVTPYDWFNPFFNPAHNVTEDHLRGMKVADLDSLDSRSLQGSLAKQRKSCSPHESHMNLRGHSMSPRPISIEAQRQNEEERQLDYVVKSIRSSSSSLTGSRKLFFQCGDESAAGHENEEIVIHRAESTDSVSTDGSDLYDSLLHSLESLSKDVAILREQNLVLSKENVKFLTQNSRLKERHRSMKKQLSITQEQIHTLQLKLKLYQPTFPYQDEDDDNITITRV